MRAPALSREAARSCPPALLILLSLLAVIGAPLPARAADWLPPAPVFRSLEADPLEPHMGIVVDGGGDRIDAALGSRFPLVTTSAGRGEAGLVLEAGGFLTLGRDGSFFPLRTFDGLFGLSGEFRRGPWSARLRLLHRSAHKADGDTSVSYRDGTYSREFVRVDVSRFLGRARLYARLGGSWHAVPDDPGIRAAAGGEWHGRGNTVRTVAAVHWETSRESNWRQTGTFFLGVAFGKRTEAVVGLRIHHGDSFQGRYGRGRVDLAGLEFRIRPNEFLP